MSDEYPRIEIEVSEFNIYVKEYTTWVHSSELAHFPYSYSGSDIDHYDVAIKKAKDFIKSLKK